MRFIRFFILMFGVIVLVVGSVVAVGHRQSAKGLWKIVFPQHVDEEWHYVEVLPTGNAVTSPIVMGWYMQWSPNNEWIVFYSMEPSEGMYIVRPDGSHRQPLPKRIDREFWWSPDSEWIYYISDAFGSHNNLFRRRIADGYEETFGFPASVCCVQWSDDGESMVVSQIVANSQRAIVHLRPDSGDQLTLFQTTDRTLFHNNHDVVSLGFAGQDAWIILRVQDGTTEDSIYRIRPDGNDRQLIATVPEDVGRISVSNDGEWIFYYQSGGNPSQLMRLSIDGTRHEPYLEDDPLLAYGIVHGTWSPDDRKLVFWAGYQGDLWLHEFNLETGEINPYYKLRSDYGFYNHFLPITFDDRDRWWWIVGVCIIVFSLVFPIKR